MLKPYQVLIYPKPKKIFIMLLLKQLKLVPILQFSFMLFTWID
jgi:hypothetical protein